MIKFIDLETGNVFDGAATSDDKSYVFWFKGEQSTDLIYTQPICFVSDKSSITITMDDNDIFKFIDLDGYTKVYDIEDIIINSNSITKSGYQYGTAYIYMLYITCTAKQAGEYIQIVRIDDTDIKVGADFYSENESLYINLSNQGVEIPRSIQKAIYTADILEDKVDNILINRKWKELLSNYWDVIANKGSHKSLINSLNWFEYGDRLRLQEVWQDKEENRLFLQDITDDMSKKYIGLFDGLSKTTYYAISFALDTIDHWTGEGNDRKPVLRQLSNKWAEELMSLKLCLLGYFYKTYFMPIHLDLLTHTIERTVFMDNIKVLTGGCHERYAMVNETRDIKCNIKNGDVFQLSPVRCYVGPNTLFGNEYDGVSSSINIIGVQHNPINGYITNDQLRDYAEQLYNEIGAVVDFEIIIPLDEGDFIKCESICFKNPDEWVSKTDNVLIENPKVKFSILCQKEGSYEVRLQFDTAKGHTFVKVVKFEVVDTRHIGLKLYKVKRNAVLNHGDILKPNPINNYTFNRFEKNDINVHKQYIPAKYSGNGVGLNHLVECSTSQQSNSIAANYFEIRRGSAGPYIYISKNFATGNETTASFSGVRRREFVFIPGFHHLEEFGVANSLSGISAEDFTISDSDALCVIPDLSFSKAINNVEWEFINVTTGETIRLDRSVKEPFIAPTEKSPLTPGYYNIKFRYRLTGEDKINEIHWDSAFIKR